MQTSCAGRKPCPPISARLTPEHRAELLAMGCVEPGTEEPIEDDPPWHSVPAGYSAMVSAHAREQEDRDLNTPATRTDLVLLVARVDQLEDVVVRLAARESS